MKANEHLVEWKGYGNIYRIYVHPDGLCTFRVKNESGWSVERNCSEYMLGADFIKLAFVKLLEKAQ